MPAKSTARRAIRRLQKKKRPAKARIVIAVDGGMAEVASHSGGPCRVIIRDYDIDGAEPRRLATDPEGRRCFEQVFNLQNES